MIEERPARPLLATLICFYEIAVVLLAYSARRSFDHWVQVAHPSLYSPTPFPQIAASELSFVLAICAAILLWRMHHAASYLLATRVALSLFSSIFNLAHPRLHVRIHWITHVIVLVIILINASIAWYAYDVTSPRKLPRRVIRNVITN